jgi:hypothetical protein
MPKKQDFEKLNKLIEGRYGTIKNVADLIAVCPHVVPSGIGIAQYLEELRKGARQLAEYLLTEEDFEEFLRPKGDQKQTPAP